MAQERPRKNRDGKTAFEVVEYEFRKAQGRYLKTFEEAEEARATLEDRTIFEHLSNLGWQVRTPIFLEMEAGQMFSANYPGCVSGVLSAWNISGISVFEGFYSMLRLASNGDIETDFDYVAKDGTVANRYAHTLILAGQKSLVKKLGTDISSYFRAGFRYYLLRPTEDNVHYDSMWCRS